MKKLSFLMATTFILVLMSGNAFAWSDRSEGRPPQYLSGFNGMSGIAVWHDRNHELHIKSTNIGSKNVISGVIQTDGRFYAIEERQLENGDYVKMDRDMKTLRFRFTGRGIDALSFKVVGGDTVDFDLYKNGREMPRNEIFIGKKGWHPWHNNFYLER